MSDMRQGVQHDLLNRTIGDLRPKLHRYCSRMTGSVVDGEDVVQDAIVKAISAYPDAGPIGDLPTWLFRIAHNAGLDFLRQRARTDARHVEEDLEMMIDAANAVEARQAAAASLATFMRLTVPQRSCVVLMDVLGYSLEEIEDLTGMSVSAVKAALHRGRSRLRELAAEPAPEATVRLPESEQSLLAAYIDRFNARDFDAVRDMLADEVRLEVVNRTRLDGKAQVGRYYTNYDQIDDWHLELGWVDGRPALIVSDPHDPTRAPRYFILIRCSETRVISIRDFRYAPYVLDGADVRLDGPAAR